MSSKPFGARRPAHRLAGLDFGLRVRIEIGCAQRIIFSGAQNLSAQELTSELAEMVSSLRVRSFVLRGQLEQVTTALQVNVQSGSWLYAERAALDLASLLAQAKKRGWADRDPCLRGANGALRIAELCGREVR